MEAVVDRLEQRQLSQARPQDPAQLGQVALERGGRIDERVLEQQRRIGGRLGLGGGDPVAHDARRPRRLIDSAISSVEDPGAPQVALEAADALARALLLDPLEVDVGLRVVGGRVRRGAVVDGLDERRAVAGARALDRLARRLVDGEHVEPVDAHARHPVADRLVGQALGRGSAPPAASRSPTGCCCSSRTSGAPVTAARFAPSWNEPSEVAPSPKYAIAQAFSPRSFLPHASPAACGTCVADRDADRGDVVVGRVPPAGGVAAPPGQHGRGGHPAQEPDRRLAVAGEDPVVVVERVGGAGLDRLVVPEDRVGADPALAVVDDRALVVRPQQHERAVQLDEIVVGEALDLPVGDRVAVADHAPEVALGRENLRHDAQSSSSGRAGIRRRAPAPTGREQAGPVQDGAGERPRAASRRGRGLEERPGVVVERIVVLGGHEDRRHRELADGLLGVHGRDVRRRGQASGEFCLTSPIATAEGWRPVRYARAAPKPLPRLSSTDTPPRLPDRSLPVATMSCLPSAFRSPNRDPVGMQAVSEQLPAWVPLRLGKRRITTRERTRVRVGARGRQSGADQNDQQSATRSGQCARPTTRHLNPRSHPETSPIRKAYAIRPASKGRAPPARRSRSRRRKHPLCASERCRRLLRWGGWNWPSVFPPHAERFFSDATVIFHGSLALGDFRPGKSDVDLLVLSDLRLPGLVQAVEREWAIDPNQPGPARRHLRGSRGTHPHSAHGALHLTHRGTRSLRGARPNTSAIW